MDSPRPVLRHRFGSCSNPDLFLGATLKQEDQDNDIGRSWRIPGLKWIRIFGGDDNRPLELSDGDSAWTATFYFKTEEKRYQFLEWLRLQKKKRK